MDTEGSESISSRTFLCVREVIFKNSNKELGYGTTKQIVTELQSWNPAYLCLHINRSHFSEH